MHYSEMSDSDELVQNQIPWLELGAIAIFLAIITTVYKYVTRGDRLTKEKETFLSEVRQLNAIPAPDEEIEHYDRRREEVFKLVLAIRAKLIPRLDTPVDPSKPPVFPEERMKNVSQEKQDALDKQMDEPATIKEFIAGAWMKELGPNDARVAKAALVNRAMANLPRYEATRSEVMGKFELYKRQLINESQWADVQRLNSVMVAEITFIKAEAELLEEGWSQSIFAIAAQLRKQAESQQAQQMQMQAMMRAQAQAKAQAGGKLQDADSSDEEEAVRQRKK